MDPNNGGIHVEQTDPIDGLVKACRELINEGPGDILCFFSGEREIRDAAEALDSALNNGKKTTGTAIDILPLFGRLSNQEQHRVFHRGKRRRIVLATNIAETSLTVPGIHYVVDTGYARISRYSHRTKVQRLPVEEISQASAKQRSGRSGRVADGIAIRLYSEDNFEARPEFTDPEILRTHLASVILSMAALDLGDISDFPFLQSPDRKSIRDGVALLQELSALTQDKVPALTEIGKSLARIPTDPRLARMLEAARGQEALHVVTVIVAALSIQDVRERPLEQQARADELHARFKADSDFVSLIKLWNYLQSQRRELSGNQFRKICREEFIHYVRVREWMDLVRQFSNIVQDLGWISSREAKEFSKPIDEADLNEEALHRSILAGLLTHIGMREGNSKQFLGTRNSHFVVHPSSNLSKKPPQWVMAAELVETSQLFARVNGPISPEWVEQIAPHMIKRNYSEPHWSSQRGAARVHEKVLMLGLPLVADRVVNLGRIDRPLARELFIRHALVEGEWKTRHRFFKHNKELISEASVLEEKARRRDILIDDDALFEFYDQRIPSTVVSSRHFDSWWKKKRHESPDLLNLSLDALIDSPDGAEAADEFPDTWRQGSLEFELSYVFEPGNDRDGITMRIPLPLLAGVESSKSEWLVAGMREELGIALIRTLPKALRTSVVPAAVFTRAALRTMTPFQDSFSTAFADALRSLGGNGINATDFDWSKVPGHLRMNFAAIDRRGKIIDQDRDLEALQSRLSGSVNDAMAQATARHATKLTKGQAASASSERGKKHNKKTRQPKHAGSNTGGVLDSAPSWTSDSLGTIPQTVNSTVDGHQVVAYPALVLKTDSGERNFQLRAFPTEQAAAAQQFKTVLDLLLGTANVSTAAMIKGLPLRQRVALESFPEGGVSAIVGDAVTLACRKILLDRGPVIRDPQKCQEAIDASRKSVAGIVRQIVVTVAPAYLAVADMKQELDGWSGEAIDDMKAQLDFYVSHHGLARHGSDHLRHVPRYVEAMRARLEMLNSDPDKEEDLDAEVQLAVEAVNRKLKSLPSSRAASPQIKDIRWMIEEFRVSLFAQHLGTTRSVSLPRIRKALNKVH